MISPLSFTAMMLDTDPVGDPFCVTEAVADVVAYCVMPATPFASMMSHEKLVGFAPFFHVGLVMTMSAGAAPLTVASLPTLSKPSVPVPIENGDPAVPPVTSAPGTVTV